MAKLSVKGLALAAGILWAATLIIVGAVNRYCTSDYGVGFLQVMDSIYPGYHASTGFKSVLVGSVYAFLDGAIGGAILAWLYNRFSRAKGA